MLQETRWGSRVKPPKYCYCKITEIKISDDNIIMDCHNYNLPNKKGSIQRIKPGEWIARRYYGGYRTKLCYASGLLVNDHQLMHDALQWATQTKSVMRSNNKDVKAKLLLL